MNKYDHLRIEIQAHTDSMGDTAYNQSLSEKRAESVRDYMVDKGIAADRMEAKGYGESQPIADNKTREGRAKNRRVELKIIE
jgi:OOP family OmpA-OmpF porin